MNKDRFTWQDDYLVFDNDKGYHVAEIGQKEVAIWLYAASNIMYIERDKFDTLEDAKTLLSKL